MLVGMSALVLLLIFKAGNPTHWRWIAWDNAPNEQETDPPQPGVDVVALAAGSDSNQVPPIEPAPVPTEDLPITEASNREPSAEAGGAERLFPGVRPDYLDAVRDDTVFRAAESDAWFHLLEILAHTDESRLSQASEGRVGYLQLDQQPAAYRGRLVTLSGVVRGAKQVTPAANTLGIEKYYQLWLQPDRSSESLVVVYCLQMPRDFPIDMKIAEEATLTGFSFKRWAYQAQGGITTAPLVLAREIHWSPPLVQEPVKTETMGESLIMAVVAALTLAVTTVIFFMWRGRGRESRNSIEARRAADDEKVTAALASLEHANTGSPATPPTPGSMSEPL